MCVTMKKKKYKVNLQRLNAVDRGLEPLQVKSDTIKLIYKIGWLGIWMFQNGAKCLIVDCCFSELAL
jgi:hypothetical protein